MIAILIFGSASAVTRKLTELGAQHSMGGHNPISFCNVLFVGNLCALAMMAAIYRHQWRIRLLKQISIKQWGTLTVVALLSAAVIPTLIFSALTLTSVNNVILIGQIDTPLALALSVVFLGNRVNRWLTVGASLAFVGVALTVFIQSPAEGMMLEMGRSTMGIQIGVGDLLVLLAAVGKAISNTISKVSLQQVPTSIL